MPLMCTGGSDGSPGAEPTITDADCVTDTLPNCGFPWEVLVFWDLDFSNVLSYEIEIYDDVNAVVAVSGLPAASGSYPVVTTVIADPSFTGFFHNAQYTVRLVRKSDSVVVDSMQTNLVTIETGPNC